MAKNLKKALSFNCTLRENEVCYVMFLQYATYITGFMKTMLILCTKKIIWKAHWSMTPKGIKITLSDGSKWENVKKDDKGVEEKRVKDWHSFYFFYRVFLFLGAIWLALFSLNQDCYFHTTWQDDPKTPKMGLLSYCRRCVRPC